MKIDRKALYNFYTEKIEQITEECDWVTSFNPREIINILVDILETNTSLINTNKE